MKIENLIEQSYTSSGALRKLNIALRIGIPFNKPHGIRIEEMNPRSATVSLPFKRKNLNHLKGMHACALATLAEFTSGLVMLSAVSSSDYRLIMKSLEMEYHYQAKNDCKARYSLSESVLESEIIQPLRQADKILYLSEVPVYDSAGALVCTGHITWQIKAWKAVKTNV